MTRTEPLLAIEPLLAVDHPLLAKEPNQAVGLPLMLVPRPSHKARTSYVTSSSGNSLRKSPSKSFPIQVSQESRTRSRNSQKCSTKKQHQATKAQHPAKPPKILLSTFETRKKLMRLSQKPLTSIYPKIQISLAK